MSQGQFDGLTPGRMAHYVLENGEHRAAIVTAVNPETPGVVSLNVQLTEDDEGHPVKSVSEVSFAEPVAPLDGKGEPTVEPGTWHWVERV